MKLIRILNHQGYWLIANDFWLKPILVKTQFYRHKPGDLELESNGGFVKDSKSKSVGILLQMAFCTKSSECIPPERCSVSRNVCTSFCYYSDDCPKGYVCTDTNQCKEDSFGTALILLTVATILVLSLCCCLKLWKKRRYSNRRQTGNTLNANATVVHGGINEQQLSGNFETFGITSIAGAQCNVQTFNGVSLLSGPPPSYGEVNDLPDIPPPSYEEAIRALPKSLSREADGPCAMNSHYAIV